MGRTHTFLKFGGLKHDTGHKDHVKNTPSCPANEWHFRQNSKKAKERDSFFHTRMVRKVVQL